MFVCTGNICRSPTAERLAAAYAADLQVPNFNASSAGTRAVIGHEIHDEAALVLEKLGGDASNFAARQLTAKVAAGADLVITMTAAHRDKVLELAPQRLRRTFTLTEASRLVSECNAQTIDDLATFRPLLAAEERADIIDPIGQRPEVFAEVGAEIATLLPPILKMCQRSAGVSGA